MLGALVTVAALVLGAPGVDLRAGVDALERTRVTTVAGESLTTTAIEATPAAALDLRGVDLDVGAGYAPVLRVPQVEGAAELDVLHRGDLHLLARLSPTWRAYAAVGGEAGTTDLRTSTGSPGVASPVPTLAIVRTARIEGRGYVEGRLDPRTIGAVRVRVTAGGGDDLASRVLVPVQQTLEAEGRIAWNATRHDVLATRLDAGTGRTPATGALYRYATLSSGLAHRYSPALEASGAVGVSWLRSVEYPDRHLSGLEPAGEAAITHSLQRPARIDTRLEVRLAPYLDPLVGGANQRLHAAASSMWQISTQWKVAARGAMGRSLTGAQRAFDSFAEVRLDWAPAERLGFGIGATSDWQRARPGTGLPAYTEYGVFVSARFEYGPRVPRAARRPGSDLGNGHGSREGDDSAGTPGGGGAAPAGRGDARGGGEPTP
ncbi:hypothetical protein [Anaeromyxobacter oryzae]|uniref:Uncharacterized protein n=1 Tax=Anaeromyxobacter oryzae TaxID=2918170 RepID=A0ABN6MYJ5_9BACT|nr:hypothetical protein [Anaeromyxobacter oryzae]BDG04618.1 hypothetical protein AMOR_36140 [Anaeromyxobacter oryzae]